MTEIQRQSPVRFKAAARTTEIWNNWPVVMAYDGEGRGPCLVDLTHKPKWDLQDGDMAQHKPLGVDIPAKPGECALEAGILINRMNRTQAAIWHLLPPTGEVPELPREPGYTDVTEAAIMLALFGPNTLAIAEKLSDLDFTAPAPAPPFLLQGPFSHVPCQVVALEQGPGLDGGLIFTCPRGYAQSMVHAVMDAGAEFGLRPAGEARFSAWIEELIARKQAD